MNETLKRELHGLVKEHAELTLKKNFTPADTARAKYLGQAISLVREGISLREINQMDLNDFEARHGLPRTELDPKKPATTLTAEQRAEAEEWQDAVFNRAQKVDSLANVERRDMVVGNPINAVGSFTGLGYFVPATFFQNIFASLKQVDALFDPDTVTYKEHTKGSPYQVATYDDVANNGVEALENADLSASGVDLAGSSEITLGAYSYRTPLFRTSREAFEDVEIGSSTIQMFKDFASKRIARIVGRRLINGTGVGQPTGLITKAIAQNGIGAVANGSSINTGGLETGANTIGSADLANLFASIDPAYLGPKTAWLMNWSTFGYLSSVVTKFGMPLVSFSDGAWRILGFPVKICPSMDSMSSRSNPVAFGDLSYYVVRCVRDPMTYVQIFQQAPGLVEKGEIGLRMFVRYDGNLMYNGTNPPVKILQAHS